MLTGKDVLLVYETLLSSPGMGDVVKMDLRMPRKQILLLAKVIELGLSTRSESGFTILQVVYEEDIKAMQAVAEELLGKGGLTAMSEKLNSLQSK